MNEEEYAIFKKYSAKDKKLDQQKKDIDFINEVYKYTFLYLNLLAIDLPEIYRKEREQHIHFAYLQKIIKKSEVIGGDKSYQDDKTKE